MLVEGLPADSGFASLLLSQVVAPVDELSERRVARAQMASSDDMKRFFGSVRYVPVGG